MLLKADSLSLSLTIALFIFVDIWVRVRTSRILCVLHSCLLLFIQKNCGATNKNCHHSRLCSWMPTCVSFLKALNGNEWFVMVGVVAAMVCPLPTPFRYDQLICHFSVSSWIAQHFKCPLWLKLEWTRDFWFSWYCSNFTEKELRLSLAWLIDTNIRFFFYGKCQSVAELVDVPRHRVKTFSHKGFSAYWIKDAFKNSWETRYSSKCPEIPKKITIVRAWRRGNARNSLARKSLLNI